MYSMLLAVLEAILKSRRFIDLVEPRGRVEALHHFHYRKALLIADTDEVVRIQHGKDITLIPCSMHRYSKGIQTKGGERGNQ